MTRMNMKITWCKSQKQFLSDFRNVWIVEIFEMNTWKNDRPRVKIISILPNDKFPRVLISSISIRREVEPRFSVFREGQIKEKRNFPRSWRQIDSQSFRLTKHSLLISRAKEQQEVRFVWYEKRNCSNDLSSIRRCTSKRKRELQG